MPKTNQYILNGKLFIVPTPIGNLKDITFRAVEVLQSVDLILAEDTRTSGKLLQHYAIGTPVQSYHMHNEHKIVQDLTQKIKSGQRTALITDAGTPGISDPGFLLVRACIAENISVETLPGATAFVPALVNSGLPSDKFVFEGFLPVKKGRQTRLKFLTNETRTLIFYESPHKIAKTLHDLSDYFGNDRKASVSRELTKIYEENIRGTLRELAIHFSNQAVKGELVIIVEGKVNSKNLNEE